MKIITRDQIGTKNKCHIQSLVKSQWKKLQGNLRSYRLKLTWKHTLETWEHDYEIGNKNQFGNISISLELSLLTRKPAKQVGNI